MYYSYTSPRMGNSWTWRYGHRVVVPAQVPAQRQPLPPIDWSPLRNFVAELVAYPLTLITYLYK